MTTAWSGIDHCVFLDDSGFVWGCGNNATGQLGLGDVQDTYDKPKLIESLFNIASISCGYEHTICSDTNGNVFSFGNNSKGQLGLSSFIVHKFKIPTMIKNLSSIISVHCGSYHTLCVDDKKRLYGFGKNDSGQLGVGDFKIKRKPTLVESIDDIYKVSCGGEHSLVLTNSQKLYSFGDNSYGQLGLGDTNNRTLPTHCEINGFIDSISCGWWFSLVLIENGELFSFGHNKNGELGQGDYTTRIGLWFVDNFSSTPTLIPNLPPIREISCGIAHSMCIDDFGRLWTFGLNEEGQIGINDNREIIPQPVLVSDNISDVCSLSSGGLVTIFKTNEDIFVCGRNFNGQLGLGDHKKRTSFCKLPDEFTHIFGVSRRYHSKSARK